MMQVLNNFSLQQYNTFGIDVSSRYFATFSDERTLQEILEYRNQLPVDANAATLILGGGSNILFTKNYDGLVLKNEMKGIAVVKEDEEYVYVKAGAGENWHQFVLYCIAQNWAGLENLSLIPGCVGASPIQNIGAYGVEIKDVFDSLDAFHLQDKKMIHFTADDCAFGYRESVFKKQCKHQFAICSVQYRLRKRPLFNTSYGAIEQELEKMGVHELSVKAVSDAVIRIRSSKLPDPKVIGNAGSFFKNPEVPSVIYDKLKQQYPSIAGYTLPNGNVKLAAGWLIEHSGPKPGVSWKGYRIGNSGCHEKQALVLVNLGGAEGNEIYDLSESIIASVHEKFGVLLEREVNIL
ncbi:MAG: UDP-N-acetylmuramate dehydrogenase [Bacteroidetes bacterium]|nr:UDP-N-acetylmuramate dehydrogenase [Bacteroidota bacterium]